MEASRSGVVSRQSSAWGEAPNALARNISTASSGIRASGIRASSIRTGIDEDGMGARDTYTSDLKKFTSKKFGFFEGEHANLHQHHGHGVIDMMDEEVV